MSLLRRLSIGTLLFTACTAGALAAAPLEQSEATLKQLYLQTLQVKTPSAYLEGRIRTERARVRNLESQDLQTVVESATNDSDTSAGAAVQKQRTLVQTLQDRRAEASVDRDLAVDEEASIEQGADPNDAEQRTAHADVLARHAVLQERIAAIDQVLTVQKDRLDRLESQERMATANQVFWLMLFLAVIAVIVILERWVRKILLSRIQESNRRYFATKIFTGFIYALLIVWVLTRIAAQFPGVITSFAIVGAAVAVALQTVIKDIVGWLIIIQKRLYAVGHRISVGPYTGDVMDITLLRTVIAEVHNTEARDPSRIGQTLYLPNSLILDRPVLNFHNLSDFMEAEVHVTVTFGSDTALAEGILREVLEEEVGAFVESARRQAARRTSRFFVSRELPASRVFMDFTNEGVRFTLRFLVPIGQLRTVVSSVTHRVLERFRKEETITFAYNHGFEK